MLSGKLGRSLIWQTPGIGEALLRLPLWECLEMVRTARPVHDPRVYYISRGSSTASRRNAERPGRRKQKRTRQPLEPATGALLELVKKGCSYFCQFCSCCGRVEMLSPTSMFLIVLLLSPTRPRRRSARATILLGKVTPAHASGVLPELVPDVQRQLHGSRCSIAPSRISGLRSPGTSPRAYLLRRS